MEGIFVRLLPICFMWMIFLPAGTSLTCYECQEKKAGDYCSQPKKQQCNGATSICLKYLHKEGKPGFPNHIIVKCDLRTYYTQNKINACERTVRNRNGALTITETCTCDTDLCNNAELNVGKMMQLEKAAPATSAPPTEAAPDHDGEEKDEGGEGEEGGGDEAVESPTPEEQQKEKSSEEATKTDKEGDMDSSAARPAISLVSHGIAMVLMQLVVLGLALTRL